MTLTAARMARHRDPALPAAAALAGMAVSTIPAAAATPKAPRMIPFIGVPRESMLWRVPDLHTERGRMIAERISRLRLQASGKRANPAVLNVTSAGTVNRPDLRQDASMASGYRAPGAGPSTLSN